MKIPCVVECGSYGNFDYELFIGFVVGFATESKKPAAIVHVNGEALEWYPLADVTTFEHENDAVWYWKQRVKTNEEKEPA